MGMSTHVEGFKPPDEKWKQMKAIYDACKVANLDPPDEVDEFFNHDPPDDAGVLVAEADLGPALKEWKDDMREGYEIEVSKLPKDVTVIRFYNSW